MKNSIRALSIHTNPSQTEYHTLMESNPRAHKTNKGNFSIQTTVTARSNESTFFVNDEPGPKPTITRAEYDRAASLQDTFLRSCDVIVVEGCIGPDADFQVPCRLIVERAYANIAAMQQQLYFSPLQDVEPLFTIIMTPSLSIQDYPNQRLIAVDLKNWTTRIFGSDYFGESKKAGLRMWNQWVYQQGGLALHAGCKVFPDLVGREELALIIGLSGTGKTTTTFRQQRSSLPVQDDFCALFPSGKVFASENGCFAKTIGLDEQDEPTIYKALTQKYSWLENVTVREDGNIDFLDGSYTTNGRGTFQLDAIPHRDPTDLPPVKYIFLLNRNYNIIPAVARLQPELAAQYFMLGETTGTSAGGKSEAGKSLRVPGTNPFFTMDDALQANRFHELTHTIPDLEVYLLNTGRVGGEESDPRSQKVKIGHSSAIIEAILNRSIHWKEDPIFHYDIVALLPDFDETDILNPYKLYKQQGRLGEYLQISDNLRKEREAYLRTFMQLKI